MNLIYRYMKPHFPRMAVGFVIKFTGTIMDLALPWILAYIIDKIVPLADIRQVLLWGVVMFFCALIAVLGNVIANRMASAVARDSIREVRNDLFAHIMILSRKQTDAFTEGSLISRMTSDTYNIHQVMGMMQRLGVRAPILLIGGIVVTMTLDPVLASILVATLPFLGGVVFYVARKGIPLYQIHQQASDKLISKVRESTTGIRVIRALSKAVYEEGRFEEINSDVAAKERQAGITMALTNPVMNFLLNMGCIGIILVGAYRVNAGLTQAGKIIAFLTYFTIILNAMLSITRLFVMFSKAGSSAGRIEEIMKTKEEIVRIPEYDTRGYVDTCSDKDNQAVDNVQEWSGTKEDIPLIRFDHVTFSYQGKTNQLDDINFSVYRNQTLGIIGATGSGKTTIIQLLMRFYDVDQGAIYIDGRDVRSFEPELLHERFGVVFQNDMLFEDSVEENIRLGRELSSEQIIEAAEWAQIREHIEAREDGFDSLVAIKGSNFSGGQKQRMLIARAIAQKPQILILDDSSSALDYKTDATVRAMIAKHLPETTTIIIAQRASSVMNCDQIVVIEEGRIIGAGNHQKLMKECEEYREINRLQCR